LVDSFEKRFALGGVIEFSLVSYITETTVLYINSMNLLILSDLHLSNNDSFSAFGWDETEFLEKLDTVCTLYSVDQIILNGDIFELCKYRLLDVVKTNIRLLTYFSNNGAFFIRGNHDYNGSQREYFCLTNGSGQKIHIEHGHKADFFGGTVFGRFLNDTIFKIMKIFSRFSFTQNLYFNILRRSEGLNHKRKYDSYNYLNRAHKLLETHDMVILSHTHYMEEHWSFDHFKPKIYLNSGTCSMGRFQGIVLNTETLQYEMIRDFSTEWSPKSSPLVAA
jgi:predicted phosphodiesterase